MPGVPASVIKAIFLPSRIFATKLIGLIDFVVFVIACHRRLNLEMVEQPDGVSRILCRDQIHFFECPQYAVRNILKISDGGWHTDKVCRFYVVP